MKKLITIFSTIILSVALLGGCAMSDSSETVEGNKKENSQNSSEIQSFDTSNEIVVIPAAKSGIMAAVVLGIGRVVGETMAVIMVAGNQARMPVSIFKGVRTRAFNCKTYSNDL